MELRLIVWWYRISFGLIALLAGGAVFVFEPELSHVLLYKGLLALYILLGIELLLGILLDMDRGVYNSPKLPSPEKNSNKKV